MPVFEYTASDRTGSLTKGEVEATDKASASRLLGSKGLFVLEIKKSTASTPANPGPIPTPAAPVASTTLAPPLTNPSSQKEAPPPKSRRSARWPGVQQALYLRQLQVLFAAGIPIHHAAGIVGDSDEHRPDVKSLLQQIPKDLERGRLLSKSLERSGLFGKLVVSSVRLGEESGRLQDILERLAESKEKSVRLKRTLVSRLSYPAVVLVVMSLGLVIMGHVMSRVMTSIPNFHPGDVPVFGQLNLLFRHWAFLPGLTLGTLLLAFLGRHIWTTRELRLLVEERLFALPLVGSLLKRLEANAVTSQLELLLSAGLPIVRGLDLCAELVWTESYRQALLRTRQELLDGAELSECFRRAGLFPQDVLALIAAGEAAGNLTSSLSKAAEYCANQVERTLESLLALLEPLLIGFLGVTIGAVLLCTFVPVFNNLQTL